MLPAIGRYRLVLEAKDPLRLPDYPGSAWRGVFGNGLRRTVCATGAPGCGGCLLLDHCVYAYVFETPPPPGTGKLRLYTAAPHPFVLEPPADGPVALDAGTRYALGLTLVGRANQHLPFIVHAFRVAGQRGIGKGNGRFALPEVAQEQVPGNGDWVAIFSGGDERLAPSPPSRAVIPACPTAVGIELLTPLRLRRGESLVGPGDFRFRDLFGSLLRRLSLLSYFHTDEPLELDFSALVHAADDVPVRQARLGWREWTRYSSRQGGTMQMGGIVGKFRLQGEGLEPFWPFLWAGQWVHAGKAATMGLGRYRLQVLASLPETTQPSV
jgi:hypothetical protein